MISLDCETTGLDLRHGARPFFVTMADEKNPDSPTFYEWDLDYLTRKPIIPEGDLEELQTIISGADRIALQHGKFDFSALTVLYQDYGKNLIWDWKKVEDCLISGHLLASNQPHDLTSMSLIYLGLNVKPLEDDLKQACQEARKIAKRDFPTWRIAAEGLPEMPSAKPDNSDNAAKGKLGSSPWKFDMALPRMLAKCLGYSKEHPWFTVLQNYSNADSTTTVLLALTHRKKMQERGLTRIYEERLKYLPCIANMEAAGVTISKSRLDQLTKEYTESSEKAGRICTGIAQDYGYDLELPKSGNNNSLKFFVFGCTEWKCPKCGMVAEQARIEGDINSQVLCPKCAKGKNKVEVGMLATDKPNLNLPVVALTDSKQPSLDKDAIAEYQATLPERSRELMFMNQLKGKRSRDTALTYMEGYQKFWVPTGIEDWFILFPSLNPTGTSTLRCSSANPNAQNISKKEDFNLRFMFGPAPGKVWYSLDYENLELRIPAYVCNERVMIELFEKPNDPPYFGSYHLMNASIIYPDLFWPLADKKGEFKKRYASTWYQWVKNFGFAFSYGCMAPTGDRAAHKVGAWDLVCNRLSEHSKLNQSKIDLANKYGVVETLPDNEVDPTRGYPLECQRSKWGKIPPTLPLNYFVQGSACWIMMRAMIKVQDYFDTLPDAKMVMQIHDEIVIELPADDPNNLQVANRVRAIMCSVGECVGVPLMAGLTRHTEHWADGESL